MLSRGVRLEDECLHGAGGQGGRKSDPHCSAAQVHGHQGDGSLSVAAEKQSLSQVARHQQGNEAQADAPLGVGAVQVQPHSAAFLKGRKRFDPQNLWSDQCLVENRQPVILKGDRENLNPFRLLLWSPSPCLLMF